MPSSPRAVPRVGVAVTTVGRWPALERLLASVRTSAQPVVVAVANQSGGPVPAHLRDGGGVRWVASTRGISRGRNDALAALAGEVDVVAFPNDHSWFDPGTLGALATRYAAAGRPGALAGSLVEPAGPRIRLPVPGTPLDRWTVWRAIEPAMFVAADLAADLGFREDLGLGSSGPWQAGEGTELLLRLLAGGHPVLAAPDLVVRGDGERRSLTAQEWHRKLRSYGRGIGRVLALHHAGPLESAAQVALPWYRFVRPVAGAGRVPAADCLQASLGRLEGRLGRLLGPAADLDREALLK